MRTLYLDCGMGAAGDMLTAALLELFDDPQAELAELNALGIPGVTYSAEHVEKCGIGGTRVHVVVHGAEEGHACEHEHHHNHEHHHHGHGMHEITHIVEKLNLADEIKGDILAVFNLVGEAESKVHGTPVPEIHFHELGTMDAIADITAVSVLLHKLSVSEIVASPVHVGAGSVTCAHGTLPVPAPATALILQGVPIYGGAIQGELCTPTGAALLKHFVSRFDCMPLMSTEHIGYGMGAKDFETANCVRAFLGKSHYPAKLSRQYELADEVIELSCNLDDMSAEDIAFAADMLREAGACEVFTSPITMKKGRLGTLLVALCTPELRETMLEVFFKHTTTLGVREAPMKRSIMNRREHAVSTSLGEIGLKKSEGYGATRAKYEFDDLARIARKKNLSLAEVRTRLAEEQ